MSRAKQKTVILALCRKLISNLIKETIEKRPGMEVIVGDGYEYVDVIAETHKPCLAVVEIPERKATSEQGDKAQSTEAQATKTLDIIKICDEIRDGSPGCKIILICPEKDTESVNECVEAKQQGHIDEFLFFDATTDYLISKIEALIVEPMKRTKRKPLKHKAAFTSAAACLIVICGALIISDAVGRTQIDPNISGDNKRV